MGKKLSTAAKVAEGLGLATIAAAAATSYFFYGQGGQKHRKDLKAWSKAAKTELVKKIKDMKTVSKQTYEMAAKEVLAKYKQAKNIDPKEVAALGNELKKHWTGISKELQKLGVKKAPVKKAAPKKKMEK